MKSSLANAPCADPFRGQSLDAHRSPGVVGTFALWARYARSRIPPELCLNELVFSVEQSGDSASPVLEERGLCATQIPAVTPSDSGRHVAKQDGPFARLENAGAFRMAHAPRGAETSFLSRFPAGFRGVFSLAGFSVKPLVVAFARLAGLRDRDLFTSRDRLRLRYAVLPGVASLLALGVSGIDFSSGPPAPFVMGGVSLVYEAGSAEEDVGARFAHVLEEQTVVPLVTVLASADDVEEADPALPDVTESPGSRPREASIRVGKGDTLAGLLHRAGLSVTEAYQAVTAMAGHVDPRDIRPGQTVSLRFEPAEGAQSYTLSKMEVILDSVRSIVVSRDEDREDFGAAMSEKDVARKTFAGRATVSSSIYESAMKAGIPAPVIAEAIRLYSYDVDFQRDIQEGDRLDVLYDAYVTEDGDVARQGKVLYASLNVGGRAIPIYRYQGKDGTADYFGPDGKSIRKSLLRTPVDGARITSGFGMRRHPILGYSKMHKGMDFGAPRGTPVYSAGAGVVEQASRFGAYGNYVRVRHNTTTKTAYAHLNGFARGLKPGTKVRQGQVIGYVGSTGRSTGPHLHYEVIVNNQQVNPAKIKMAGGDSLRGRDLARFKAQAAEIRKTYAALSGDGLKVAQAESSGAAPN